MSLDIAIKIDPGTTITTLKGVEDGLAKTEAKGKAASQAVAGTGSALRSLAKDADQERAAMARSAEIHERLTRASSPLAQNLSKLAEQLQREKQMLEQIRGPQMEYFDKLTALDKLLERNVITTKEYAEQVANMNQKMGETPEPKEHHEGGMGAVLGAVPGGNIIGGLAGGGIAEATTEGLKGLVEAIHGISESIEENRERMREMKDEYTQAQNAAHKFADEGHTTNQVISDQQGLAHDLHSSFESTIDVYDSVRDGTDGLNLTYEEQIRLTKTLGQSIQLAGKSLGEAGGLMQRFSYDMATGQASAGDLASIMKKVPPIADLWTEHFGKSQTEIIALVKEGKISVKDLMNVLIEDGGKSDEKWKGNKQTIAEWRAEVKHAYEVARGSGKDYDDAINESFEKNNNSAIDLDTRLKAARELARGNFEEGQAYMAAVRAGSLETSTATVAASENTAQAFSRFNDIAEKNVAKWHEIDDAAHGARGALAMLDVIDPLSEGINGLSNELGMLGDKLADLPLNRALGMAQARAAEVREAKIQLQALRDEYKMDASAVVDFAGKQQALEDTIHGVTGAMRAQINAAHELFLKLKEGEKRNMDVDHSGPKSVTNFGMVGVDENAKAMSSGRAFQEASQSSLDQQAADIFKKNKEDIEKSQDDLAKKAEEDAQRMRDAWASGAGSIAGDLISAFEKGDQSMSKMVEHAIVQLALLELKMEAAKIGGSGGAFLSAAIGSLSFSGGGDFMASSMPHASAGNDWTVRGGGGGATDTRLVQFMASDNESVHIRTPSQRAVEGGSGGSGPTTLHANLIMPIDERDIVASGLNSRQGMTAMVKANRKMNRR
jgi:tape measure domain-containing protein